MWRSCCSASPAWKLCTLSIHDEQRHAMPIAVASTSSISCSQHHVSSHDPCIIDTQQPGMHRLPNTSLSPLTVPANCPRLRSYLPPTSNTKIFTPASTHGTSGLPAACPSRASSRVKGSALELANLARLQMRSRNCTSAPSVQGHGLLPYPLVSLAATPAAGHIVLQT